MASKIKIYGGEVTPGYQNGTLITAQNPVESGVIKVLESGYATGSWVKLALRCDEGYETVEEDSRHVRVSIIDSTSVDKWQLALDDGGTQDTPEDWGDPLDFTSRVGDTNICFWVRARAASTEDPQSDTSVSLEAVALIGAAEDD